VCRDSSFPAIPPRICPATPPDDWVSLTDHWLALPEGPWVLQDIFGAAPDDCGAPQNVFGVPPDNCGVPLNQFGVPQNIFGAAPDNCGAPQKVFGVPPNDFWAPPDGCGATPKCAKLAPYTVKTPLYAEMAIYRCGGDTGCLIGNAKSGCDSCWLGQRRSCQNLDRCHPPRTSRPSG